MKKWSTEIYDINPQAPMNVGRRGFIQMIAVGTVALSLPSISTAAQIPEADVLQIKSGESLLAPWSHHFHYLEIPLEVLDSPPRQGIVLKTTKTLLHRHTIRLTQQQLLTIRSGQTVTVLDTLHDHLYEVGF